MNNKALPVRDSYDQVFQQELDSYADALDRYPGEIFPEFIFRLVRQLEDTFVAAISHNVAFDILAVSRQLARAGKFLVHEKDVVFCILSVLPPPSKFDEEAQYALGQIVEQVENTHGGALERLQKKWRWELKFEREQRAKKAAA